VGVTTCPQARQLGCGPPPGHLPLPSRTSVATSRAEPENRREILGSYDPALEHSYAKKEEKENEKKERTVGGSLGPEEIIEVDDSETPAPAKKPATSKALSSGIKLLDTDQLCDFPVGVSPNVTVALQDYKTLEHDTFLNDIVIDFYLTYLQENVLTKEDKPNVHIFARPRVGPIPGFVTSLSVCLLACQQLAVLRN
jgi:hypothetical protein